MRWRARERVWEVPLAMVRAGQRGGGERTAREPGPVVGSGSPACPGPAAQGAVSVALDVQLQHSGGVQRVSNNAGWVLQGSSGAFCSSEFLQREAKGFRTVSLAADAAYLSLPSESRALSTVGLELDGRNSSAAARALESHRPSCSRAGPRAPGDPAPCCSPALR